MSAWSRVPHRSVKSYHPFAREFCPAVRMKPFDYWKFQRVLYRVALPNRPSKYVSRILFAFHYIWRTPFKSEIVARRKRKGDKAFPATVKKIHKSFQDHVKLWGPGDAELVTLILQRESGAGDPALLDPAQFHAEVIAFRNGATLAAGIDRLTKFQWDKISRNIVTLNVRTSRFEMDDERPVLTIENYHHSFRKPNEVGDLKDKWREVVVPRVAPFTAKDWQKYKISTKKRGHEPWEV